MIERNNVAMTTSTSRVPSTILVTGATRGIGLEFVRQLVARGDRVIASVRDPKKAGSLDEFKGRGDVTLVALDVSNPLSIEGLGARLGDTPIDVLINNAGVSSPQKTLETVTADELARVFQINAFAPLLVTRSVLPCLNRGTRKLVCQVTSQLASIHNNTGGSTYAYRGSKAALNQLNKSLSVELAPAGFTCVAIHPGWVRTDMGGPSAHLSPEESVAHMLRTLDTLTIEDTGRFLNFDGATLPW